MRFLIFAALITVALPVGACTMDQMCADVANSLVGGFIADGFAPPAPHVELAWVTRSELQSPRAPQVPNSASSSLTYVYRVSRCSSPNRCEWIATVRAVGRCGAEQPYTVIDRSEPAPIYRLEVIDPRGRMMCSVDTVPITPNVACTAVPF